MHDVEGRVCLQDANPTNGGSSYQRPETSGCTVDISSIISRIPAVAGTRSTEGYAFNVYVLGRASARSINETVQSRH